MRTRRAGAHALLIDCGTPDRVADLYAEICRRRTRGDLPPIADVVPGAQTVLLDGIEDPAIVDKLATEIPDWVLPAQARAQGPVVELPTVYDGPDLPDVARLAELSIDEVIDQHSRALFTVQFCGFMPGFGYLTGVPEPLRVPRRTTPRARVPAGSVALAGEFTGVYPRNSPGGWQLLGRTDAVLWDAERSPAALLAPGTQVRFRPSRP